MKLKTVKEAKAAFATDLITADELEQVIHRLEFEQTVSPIVLHRDLPAKPEPISTIATTVGPTPLLLFSMRLIVFSMGLAVLVWQALGPQEPTMLVLATGAMGFWGLPEPS